MAQSDRHKQVAYERYTKAILLSGKLERLTISPLEMLPPNKRSAESDMAVESRRKTEFTLIFSLKTSHGYGILEARAFTEFW